MGSLSSRPKAPRSVLHLKAADMEGKPYGGRSPDGFWLDEMNREKERHRRAIARIRRTDTAVKIFLAAMFLLMIFGPFLWEMLQGTQ